MNGWTLRCVWAAFMAGLTAYTFHRSWRWEHPQEEKWSGATGVWGPPLTFPIVLPIFLVLIFFHRGPRQAVGLVVDVTVMLSLTFGLIVVLLPVLRRRFSARACATVWLVPAILFFYPVNILRRAGEPIAVVYVPGQLWKPLMMVWGVGFIGVFAFFVVSHLRFRHRLMASARPASREEEAIFREEIEAIGYQKTVKLLRSDAATSPLSMGVGGKGQVVFLPSRTFREENLRLIFRHELHHLQRLDVDAKVCMAFCTALCWFNPLVWIAARRAGADLELSCDEIVMEGAGETERRRYAELLLDTAGDGRGFTSCLSAAASAMRYRLRNIVAPRQRRKGVALLAMAMFCCTMGFSTVAVADQRGTVGEVFLTEEDITIDSVYFCDGQGESAESEQVWAWDNELLSYILQLPVQTLLSAGERNDYETPYVAMWLRGSEGDGLRHLMVTPSAVELWNSAVSLDQTQMALLRSTVDWEKIRSCLDLTAAPPAEVGVVEPELQLTVHAGTGWEPVSVVCSEWKAYNNTEGVLRAQRQSVEPTDLSGAAGEQVTIGFGDFTPEMLILTANDTVTGLRTVEEVELTGETAVIRLLDKDAQYQLFLRATLGDVTYDATFLFAADG